MSRSTLRTVIAALLFAFSGVALFVRPAFACHLPTGWCCLPQSSCPPGHPWCCYFENNELVPGTCGCLGDS